MSRHRDMRGIADEAEDEVWGDYDEGFGDDYEEYDEPAPVVKAKPKKAAVAAKPKAVEKAKIVAVKEEPKPVVELEIDELSPSVSEPVVVPVDTGKPSLNLVVAGHVDNGKSTLVGHLLVLLGRVSQKTLRQLESESSTIGRSSFSFAWIFDSQAEERNRGITIDVGHNWFETTNRRITILDCPGHRDFIPNMLAGAAQADAAILVVSAKDKEFDAGFGQGQTREHALLLRAMGVKEVIVAVNKMDACDFDENKYTMVKSTLTPFLVEIGFLEEDIRFAPVSGWLGVNLSRKGPEVPEMKWYQGDNLLKMIDTLQVPVRNVHAPLRMVVTDVNSTLALGLTVTGKIDAGHIKAKQKLVLMPALIPCNVRGVQVCEQNVDTAFAGESVNVGLRDIDGDVIRSGMVLCPADKPISLTSKFKARIVTVQTQKQTPVLPGAMLTLHLYNNSYLCHVSKICSTTLGATNVNSTSESNGKVVAKPRVIPTGAVAEVEITVNQAICLEPFDACPGLGRFSLRKDADNVAVGVVMELLQ